MVLDRQALESKLLQQLLTHPELDLEIWSDQQLKQSIKLTRQQHASRELWIFAYGSLIWNPLFEYSDRCVAVVEGWHRRFNLLAPVGRGTVENPGLVLGLEPEVNSYCQGVAYQLPQDENLDSELLLLWRREMVVGSYLPTWITAKSGDRQLQVLAFVVNSQHPTYVNWSEEEIIQSLATAKGDLGSSAEYLSNTVQGLLSAGIAAQDLIELEHLVKARQQLI